MHTVEDFGLQNVSGEDYRCTFIPLQQVLSSKGNHVLPHKQVDREYPHIPHNCWMQVCWSMHLGFPSICMVRPDCSQIWWSGCRTGFSTMKTAACHLPPGVRWLQKTTAPLKRFIDILITVWQPWIQIIQATKPSLTIVNSYICIYIHIEIEIYQPGLVFLIPTLVLKLSQWNSVTIYLTIDF